MSNKSNLVDVGRITAVFGVKGWVKIDSFTQPFENIQLYQPWWLKTAHGVKAVEVVESKPHGNVLIAQIKGVNTRDDAERYRGVTIAVERDLLPELDSDEYYWHQLEGLTVVSEYNGVNSLLGIVDRLMETGANDVLVIKGNQESIDQRERLIPYIPEQFVKSVDLSAGQIIVDWDPEF